MAFLQSPIRVSASSMPTTPPRRHSFRHCYRITYTPPIISSTQTRCRISRLVNSYFVSNNYFPSIKVQNRLQSVHDNQYDSLITTLNIDIESYMFTYTFMELSSIYRTLPVKFNARNAWSRIPMTDKAKLIVFDAIFTGKRQNHVDLNNDSSTPPYSMSPCHVTTVKKLPL